MLGVFLATARQVRDESSVGGFANIIFAIISIVGGDTPGRSYLLGAIPPGNPGPGWYRGPDAGWPLHTGRPQTRRCPSQFFWKKRCHSHSYKTAAQSSFSDGECSSRYRYRWIPIPKYLIHQQSRPQTGPGDPRATTHLPRAIICNI